MISSFAVIAVLALLACAVPAEAKLWELRKGPERQAEIEKIFSPKFSKLGSALCNTKTELMSGNTWPFYRGNDPLYWYDLYTYRVITSKSKFSGDYTVSAWLQGDLHIGNMGVYHNKDNEIVFGLNDFDESVHAHYLYDLYRLATSFALVGKASELEQDEISEILETLGKAYANKLGKLHKDGGDDKFRWTVDDAEDQIKELLENAAKKKEKVRREEMLNKWSKVKPDGKGRAFLDIEKLGKVDSATYDAVVDALADYVEDLKFKGHSEEEKQAYFKVKDVNKRLLAGLGSFGTERYYVLVEGATDSPKDDRILDVKIQEFPAAVIRDTNHFPAPLALTAPHAQAERTIVAYKALVHKADHHLGTLTLHGKSFSVRERSPYKKALKTEEVQVKAKELKSWAKQYGKILAASHARADGTGKDDFEKAAYKSITKAEKCKCDKSASEDCHVKCFAEEVRDFALAYSKQVQTDFALFKDSNENGSICACTGGTCDNPDP